MLYFQEGNRPPQGSVHVGTTVPMVHGSRLSFHVQMARTMMSTAKKPSLTARTARKVHIEGFYLKSLIKDISINYIEIC